MKIDFKKPVTKNDHIYTELVLELGSPPKLLDTEKYVLEIRNLDLDFSQIKSIYDTFINLELFDSNNPLEDETVFALWECAASSLQKQGLSLEQAKMIRDKAWFHGETHGYAEILNKMEELLGFANCFLKKEI